MYHKPEQLRRDERIADILTIGIILALPLGAIAGLICFVWQVVR